MKQKALSLTLAILLLLPLAACGSKISQEQYDQAVAQQETLQHENEELKQENKELQDKLTQAQTDLSDKQKDLETLQAEFNTYQDEMKPFEGFSASDAEQFKQELEQKKTEAHNQELASAAVAKIWDYPNGRLASGATRQLYDDAYQKVNQLTDESQKSTLMEAVNAANSQLTAQEQAEAAKAEAKAAEAAASSPNVSSASSGTAYILNTNTYKFHKPSCSSVRQMNDANRQEYCGSREAVIAQGYSPCKRCNP